jgi:hypothetical protein
MISSNGYNIEIGLVRSMFASSAFELLPNIQDPIRLRTDLDMCGLADEPSASVKYDTRDCIDYTCVEVVALATRKITSGGDPAERNNIHVHAIPGYFGGCSISRDRGREAAFSLLDVTRAFNVLAGSKSKTAPAVYVVYMTTNRTYLARAEVDLNCGVRINIPYTMFDTRNYPKSPQRTVGIGLPPEGKFVDDSITRTFYEGCAIFIYHSIEAAIKHISEHAAKYLHDNVGNCRLDQWTHDLAALAEDRVKVEEARTSMQEKVQAYINTLPQPPYIKEDRKFRVKCALQIAGAVAFMVIFFALMYYFNH